LNVANPDSLIDRLVRRLAAWLLPVLIDMACFALWRELPFFAGAKKRNPKKAPLEAKPLFLFYSA